MPFTVSDPLHTTPAKEEVSPLIAPRGLYRPGDPHGLSDRQIAANGNIAARFQIAAQREAFRRDPAGAC